MKRILLALAASALLAGAANAQLIAGDSYQIGSNLSAGQYPDGTALSNSGVLGAAGGTGNVLQTPGFLNGRYGGGSGTAQFAATSGGLAYAPFNDTSAGSGKVTFAPPSLDNVYRSTARTLSPSLTGSPITTFYESALVNRGAVSTTTTGRDFVLAGFGNASSNISVGTAGVTGLFFGFTGDAGNLAIRYRDNSNNGAGVITETQLLNGAPTVDNATYALVFKIEQNYVGGTADRLTYWVNPTDPSSDTTLTATSLSTGVITNDNILSSPGDFIRLNYVAHNYDSSAFFDEVNLGGNTPASVTPNIQAGVVPEAGTISLLLTGGIALAGIVVRRRKTA